MLEEAVFGFDEVQSGFTCGLTIDSNVICIEGLWNFSSSGSGLGQCGEGLTGIAGTVFEADREVQT